MKIFANFFITGYNFSHFYSSLRHISAPLLGVFLLCTSVVANTQINGEFSLPSDIQTFSSAKSLHIDIGTGWNGFFFENYTSCGQFTLPANTRSGSYSCSFTATGEVGVRVTSDLPGIYTESFYHGDGTVWEMRNAGTLSAGSTHSNINIELYKGITISGKVETPYGEVFGSNHQFILWWAVSSWSKYGDYFTLLKGENFLTYALKLPKDGPSVKLTYEWAGNPVEGYPSEGYYHSLRTVETYSEGETLSTSQDRSDIDIALLKTPKAISGTVTLPWSGALNDLTFEVIAYEYPGTPLQIRYDYLVLNKGETSIDYTVEVPGISGQFIIGYCFFNNWPHEGIHSEAFYSSTGMTKDPTQATPFNKGTDYINIDVSMILEPLHGDYNGDRVIDLSDAIIALQVLAGYHVDLSSVSFLDASGDNVLGMADVIAIMNRL